MTSVLREAVRAVKRARLESDLRRATGEDVKLANSRLNWREYWHKRVELNSRPRLMQIGTNWTCNLKCNFCRLTLESTQKELKAKPPRELEISDRVFDTVMELMPYPETITLTPLGEPLLYSKFGRVLERHGQLGSHNLAMTSNANLITDERAEMLVDGGMNHIFVSVDSDDPDVYASMRVRGELHKVENALQSINKWKRKLGKPRPTMTLASTFMERNVRQMPSLVDFAVRHGFEVYSVQLMEMENPELEDEFLGNHIELAREMVIETMKRAEGKPVRVHINIALRNLMTKGLSLPERRQFDQATDGRTDDPMATVSTKGQTLMEKCHYPWYFALIDTDGDCRPCCWTGISFGNLNKLSFDEVWNGEGAVGMRRDFLNNHIPKACQNKHCRVDLNHSGTME